MFRLSASFLRPLLVLALAPLLIPAHAFASACSSPNGNAGDQFYNTTYNVMEYCNGTNWVSMSGGGTSASAGGSNGQVEYNNAGSLGGFTVSGDCTLVTSSGVITCTKTNGNALAASSTNDTTNASNISSGTLGAGEMPALTGDVTSTAGTVATTAVKLHGVAYAASPSTNTVPVITASNTATYETMPNCTDSSGNHLNYNNSTNAFSCGTSSSSTSSQWTSGSGNIYYASGYVGIGTATPNSSYTLTVSTASSTTGNILAVGYFHSSDRRLKHDIVAFDRKGLPIIEGIQTVHFNWNSNNKEDYGVIAQEVQKVLPEVVYRDDKGFLAVQYDKLVLPAIEAIKELAADLRGLETRIAALEQKIAALSDWKSKTAALENRIKTLETRQKQIEAHDRELESKLEKTLARMPAQASPRLVPVRLPERQ